MTKKIIIHTFLLFTFSLIYFHEFQYLQYMLVYDCVLKNITIMK